MTNATHEMARIPRQLVMSLLMKDALSGVGHQLVTDYLEECLGLMSQHNNHEVNH